MNMHSHHHQAHAHSHGHPSTSASSSRAPAPELLLFCPGRVGPMPGLLYTPGFSDHLPHYYRPGFHDADRESNIKSLFETHKGVHWLGLGAIAAAFLRQGHPSAIFWFGIGSLVTTFIVHKRTKKIVHRQNRIGAPGGGAEHSASCAECAKAAGYEVRPCHDAKIAAPQNDVLFDAEAEKHAPAPSPSAPIPTPVAPTESTSIEARLEALAGSIQDLKSHVDRLAGAASPSRSRRESTSSSAVDVGLMH